MVLKVLRHKKFAVQDKKSSTKNVFTANVTKRPVGRPPTKRPVGRPPTRKYNLVTKRPVGRPPTKRPVGRPPTKRPVGRPPTRKDNLVTKRPVGRPPTKRPVGRPPTKRPVGRPPTRKYNLVTKRPVGRPPTKRPVGRPPTRKYNLVTKRPVGRPPTKRPVGRPPTRKDNLVTKRPVGRPPTKRPVGRPPTRKDNLVTKRPVGRPPTKRPVGRPPTKRPVGRPPTKRPVGRPPTRKDNLVTKRPVGRPPTKRPADAPHKNTKSDNTYIKNDVTLKPKKTRVVCISHKEDTDGISSAALVKQAFGGDSVLVDYPGQMDALRETRKDDTLKSLFICDLGLSKTTQDEFLEIMTALRKRRVSVTYIDHHDLDPKVIQKLQELKVKMIHDIDECTTVQVYNAFKSKLDDHASFVATCAAITDYMEDRPLGSKLLQMYDKQFALISATVLTYNIVGHQKDPDYLLYLVDELADSKFPHEMPNSFEHARLQVGKLSEMITQVKENLKTMKNLGYMEVIGAGAGGAVNFVMGLSGKDVGVAYKERIDHGIYAVSVRGSQYCKFHLGKIVNNLAADLGGSGGGHSKACGAVIPKPNIKKFVTELNKKIT